MFTIYIFYVYFFFFNIYTADIIRGIWFRLVI